MAVADFGRTVKVHYTVKLEDGTVVDNTRNHEPFIFTVGTGQVIPGFETEVIGMSLGEKKSFKVPVEDAYGEYYKELVTEVDKKEFPDDFQFEAGQHLEFPGTDGQVGLATVLKVTDTTVIFDRNHPLAGKELFMDIEILEVI
ncbi:MAG: peptidylprolyl isomerase [Nitrospirota bacterium]